MISTMKVTISFSYPFSGPNILKSDACSVHNYYPAIFTLSTLQQHLQIFTVPFTINGMNYTNITAAHKERDQLDATQ